MAYIKLDNDIVIPKCNFSFIYDVTKENELFTKFFEFEQMLKVNYIDFSHKLRIAFEGFAVLEEAKKRKQQESNSKDIKLLQKEILQEINAYGSVLNYKKIVQRLTRDTSSKYGKMLRHYGFTNNFKDDPYYTRSLKNYIVFLYKFTSVSSHMNIEVNSDCIPNKENCIRIIKSFYDFLCIYYKIDRKFDITIVPVKDYIAVSKEETNKMGLSLEKGKTLYVKMKNNKCNYYIFSSNSSDISLSQRRDNDTINKLWEENFNDPANVIRQTESIVGSNNDYKFQVYSLPNRPLKLTPELLTTLDNNQRIDIIKGICNGILSMHNYNPSFYHRNICPEAFYIFNIKGKYKALLARFDCTKDTSDDVTYTVYNAVEKKIASSTENSFFAPEVLRAVAGKGVDWVKADTYSLAKLCLYILTGSMYFYDEEKDAIYNIPLEDDIKLLLIEMLDTDPQNRPHLKTFLETLQ